MKHKIRLNIPTKQEYSHQKEMHHANPMMNTKEMDKMMKTSRSKSRGKKVMY